MPEVIALAVLELGFVIHVEGNSIHAFVDRRGAICDRLDGFFLAQLVAQCNEPLIAQLNSPKHQHVVVPSGDITPTLALINTPVH